MKYVRGFLGLREPGKTTADLFVFLWDLFKDRRPSSLGIEDSRLGNSKTAFITRDSEFGFSETHVQHHEQCVKM